MAGGGRGEPFDGDFDALIAELVAAGCGDWDRIEVRWNLLRYAAMQRCWSRNGPPAYRSLALHLGLVKPPSDGGRTLDTPDALAAFLNGLPQGA